MTLNRLPTEDLHVDLANLAQPYEQRVSSSNRDSGYSRVQLPPILYNDAIPRLLLLLRPHRIALHSNVHYWTSLDHTQPE